MERGTAALRGHWGEPVWAVTAAVPPAERPPEVDIAVVGGGVTGLAAAAWLGLLEPAARVVVLEAGRIGDGATCRSAGMVLDEAACGELPDLSILQAFQENLEGLNVDCDLRLNGIWELTRNQPEKEDSPVRWQDAGVLTVGTEVRGGVMDPGKLMDGLVKACVRHGVTILEETPVVRIRGRDPIRLELRDGVMEARKVLVAVNGCPPGVDLWPERVQAKFGLVLVTEELPRDTWRDVTGGLKEPKAFYALDPPQLWGRTLADRRLLVGADLPGSVTVADVERLRVTEGDCAAFRTALERRVRGFHPALGEVQFTHWWGGPLLMEPSGRLLFRYVPGSTDVLLLGAFTGHGLALAPALSHWAAQVLLGEREPPEWGR